MAREIKLTQGKVALVDDEDYELVSKYKWHAHRTWSGHWYAKTNSGALTMHRLIMRPQVDEEIDHIDGNGLNNQRANLRVCQSWQNKGNSEKSPGKSSKYKGVCWDKSRNKWIVHIHRENKQFFLGRFDDEREAAQAYDRAAKEHFGEFARTNY
jgi:hypothetical protein